jgi:hypothetical protein
MNLMGKIFTLLIFFMSICFLVMALMVGASHRNWKAIATEKKNEADLAQTILDQSKAKTSEKEKLLSSERTGRAMQLAQLESQFRAARENYISKESQLRSESEISQSRLAELEQAQARIKAQDIEVAGLKANNSKLVDDISTQYQSVQNLTNQSYELKNQITLLTEKEGDLVAKLAKTKRVLDRNGLTEDSLTDHIIPNLDGLVVKVSDDGLKFVISLGADDGVRVGHVMDVYRKDKYVGKGTVIKTETDLSAVRIDPDFKLDMVREGDYVTSKF